MDGKLITFEGGEGAGKGTQIKLLRNRLICEGYNVSDLDLYEPGSTPIGDIARIIVKNKVDKDHLAQFQNVHDYISNQDITPFSQVCGFMLSRSEIYDKVIRPELEVGKIVILDRSIDSSTVYQGHAQNPDLVAFIREMNERAIGSCHIAKTFYLDVPVEVGLARMAQRDGLNGDRFQDMNIDFHEGVRQGYLAEASVFPDRIAVVDGNRTPDEIHEEVYGLVSKLL
ncbi:MAG: dTMP kinase [Nanoarchaeota archaeon]